MNRRFESAAHGLIYYFRLCMEGCGKRWDSDNAVEIRQIIEDIFEGTEYLITDKIDNHIASRYHAE